MCVDFENPFDSWSTPGAKVIIFLLIPLVLAEDAYYYIKETFWSKTS